MSRSALATVLAAAALSTLAAGCSKSGTKDSKVGNTAGPEAAASGAPDLPARGAGAPGGEPAGAAVAAKGGVDDIYKLKADEGAISIEVPADAVAGQETIARVVVTPSPKFKINFEYSSNLKLQAPEGVAIAKAELKAGGLSKEVGDAEKFEEKQLAFAVKLTPQKSGSHTVNGMFKFAVCDKDKCLPKKEAIAIQVAAK